MCIRDRFHTSLQIPHYYDPRNDTVFVPGMTFTVEPMINIGCLLYTSDAADDLL